MTTAAAPATPPVDPFRLFGLTVLRTERLSPSMLRVTFGGPGLDGFASGGRDQSLSLFLPHPGQPEPVVPVDNEGHWFGPWRALPAEERAVLRSYTVRAQRRTGGGSATEIDIDFALHEDGGPACRWAAAASPGDVLKALGPAVEDNTAVRFRPPEDTDWVLIWADETALPAATAALEWLPAHLRAWVWLEVTHTGDRQAIDTAADARISWLVRDEDAPDAVEAVRAAELPEGNPVRLDRGRGVLGTDPATPSGARARHRPQAGDVRRLLAPRPERGPAPRGGGSVHRFKRLSPTRHLKPAGALKPGLSSPSGD